VIEALESRLPLTASNFAYDSVDQHLDVTFDSDLHDVVRGSDLSLYNVSTDTFIDGITVTFGANNLAQFRFPTSHGTGGQLGVLPDGYYRAAISAEDVPELYGN
jgi:hypothetical protein